MSDPCIPNIGPRQRRIRFASGVVGSLLAIGLDAALVVNGTARPWRLTIALPLLIAVYGFLQAYAKT
jgi:hypothetical protein